MKLSASLLALACLCACLATHAEDKPAAGLLQTMSVADFRAMGLDHLSDAQLKALDEWFSKHTQHGPAVCTTPPPASVAIVPAPTVAVAPVSAISAAAPVPASRPAVQPATDDVIVAHLAGKFTGLSSGARFKLDNGQVWEQVDDLTLTMGAMPNPKVTITKGAFNAHYLAIEGVSDTVMVKQVQP